MVQRIIDGQVVDFLTEQELIKIIKACKHTGDPLHKIHAWLIKRNRLMTWLSYRHGLRRSEMCNLQWKFIDWQNSKIFIQRCKRGISASHPLGEDQFGNETSQLKNFKALTIKHGIESIYIFPTIKGTKQSGRSVAYLISKLGELTNIDNLHHHRLRHSCGYHMILKDINPVVVKNWLGHKNIETTMIYCNAAGKQFDNIKW